MHLFTNVTPRNIKNGSVFFLPTSAPGQSCVRSDLNLDCCCLSALGFLDWRLLVQPHGTSQCASFRLRQRSHVCINNTVVKVTFATFKLVAVLGPFHFIFCFTVEELNMFHSDVKIDGVATQSWCRPER